MKLGCGEVPPGCWRQVPSRKNALKYRRLEIFDDELRVRFLASDVAIDRRPIYVIIYR